MGFPSQPTLPSGPSAPSGDGGRERGGCPGRCPGGATQQMRSTPLPYDATALRRPSQVHVEGTAHASAATDHTTAPHNNATLRQCCARNGETVRHTHTHTLHAYVYTNGAVRDVNNHSIDTNQECTKECCTTHIHSRIRRVRAKRH